jgi:hypothetical protein
MSALVKHDTTLILRDKTKAAFVQYFQPNKPAHWPWENVTRLIYGDFESFKAPSHARLCLPCSSQEGTVLVKQEILFYLSPYIL